MVTFSDSDRDFPLIPQLNFGDIDKYALSNNLSSQDKHISKGYQYFGRHNYIMRVGLQSAEEDNLSPFDLNIACLCHTIESNLNKHSMRVKNILIFTFALKQKPLYLNHQWMLDNVI